MSDYRALLGLDPKPRTPYEEEQERKRKALLTPPISPTETGMDPYRAALGLETSPMYQRRYGSPKVGENEQRTLFETIAAADDPVALINQINSSRYLAETFGVDQGMAFQNLDEASKYWMGRVVPPATLKENLRSAWRAGAMNWEIGILAKRLKDGGGSDAALEAKIAALEQRVPQYEMPKPWLQKALLWAAQSMPAMALSFAQGGALGAATGATSGAMIGAVAAPVTSGISVPALTAAMGSVGFVTGTIKSNLDYMEGLSYLDQRKKGVPHSIAAPLSTIDGLVQAAIESAQVIALLPKVPGVGQVFKGAASTAVKKIMASGALTTAALRLTGRVAGVAVEEGVEESLQELSSIVKEQVAREVAQEQGIVTQIEPGTWDQLFDRLGESFVQGASAAIVLGGGSAALQIRSDVQEQNRMRQAARVIPDEDQYVEAITTYVPKPANMTQGDYEQGLRTVHQQEQTARTEEQKKAAAAPPPTPPAEDFRTEEGRYFARVELESEANGVPNYVMAIGNPDTQERYGHVRYEETADRILITEIETTKGEDRTRDMVLELAARNPGTPLEWLPVDEEQAELVDRITQENPRGAQYGLQWFEPEEDVAGPAAAPQALTQDIFRRRMVEGFHLSEQEAAPFTVFNDIMARNEGIPVGEWLNKYFEPEVVAEGGAASVAAHGALAATAFRAGGQAVNPLEVDREQYKGKVRAVFSALETADFHHATHEYFHAIERLALNKEQIGTFENALGKLRQTWTEQDVETLADRFEVYLGTGKAPTAELQTVFQQIAEMLHKLVSWLKEHVVGGQAERISPEFTAAYDRMFADPASGVAQAAAAATPAPAGMTRTQLLAEDEHWRRVFDERLAQLEKDDPERAAKIERPDELLNATEITRRAEVARALSVRRATDTEAGKVVAPTAEEPTGATSAIEPSRVPIVEVPVSELTLSAEVPNFKEGANKRGIVREIQDTEYRRLPIQPIVVWERLSGAKEVITGRHRLDLARRLGEKTIPAQVMREADGFTAAMAIMLDAEANIRDEQGSVRDYATYFKHSTVSEAEASSRGLLRGDKGRAGFALGRHAAVGLYTLWWNGGIGEEKAAAIAAAAPGNEDLQAAGITAAKDMTAEELGNYLAILPGLQAREEAIGTEGAAQGELPGMERTGNAQVVAAALARQAAKLKAEIKAEAATLKGALRLSKGDRAKIVEQYGFKAGDTDAIERRIAELEAELLAADDWKSSPEKQAELLERATVDKETMSLFHPPGSDQATETFGTDREAPLVEEAKQYPDVAAFRAAIEAVGTIEGAPGADVSPEDATAFYQRIWEKAHPIVPLSEKRATADFLELLQKQGNAQFWAWVEQARTQGVTGSLPPAMQRLVKRISAGKRPAAAEQWTAPVIQSALKQIRRQGRLFRGIYAAAMGDTEMQRQLETERGPEPVTPQPGVPLPGAPEPVESSPEIRGEIADAIEDPALSAKVRSGEITEADLAKREQSNLEALARLRKNQAEAVTDKVVAQVARQLKEAERERLALLRVRKAKKALAARITRETPGSVDFEYKEMIRLIAEGVDPHFRAERTQYRREASRAFFAANPEALAALDPETWKRLQAKNLNELSLTELEDMTERVKELERLGKFKRGLKVRQEQRFRKNERAKVQAVTLRGKEPEEAVGAAKKTNVFLSGLLSTLKPDRVMLIMDGGTPGPFTEILDNYNKGWNAQQRNGRRRRESIVKLMDELKMTTDRVSAKRLQGYAWLGEAVDIDGFRYHQGTWQGKQPTVQDVMFWYIGMQNRRTRVALLKGNNLPEAVIEQGIAKLTDDQKRLADAIGKEMNDNFPALRQAFIERYNMDLPGEDHYVPMRRMEGNYKERSTEVAADLVARNGLGKAFVQRHQTHERIEVPDYWQTPIKTRLIDVWLQSIEESEGFIHLDLPVKRMHSILEDPLTKQAISQRWGSAANGWLSRFTNNLARPDIYANLTGLDRLQRFLRQNIVIAYLGFNLLSAAKNLTTILPYLADAGAGHLVSAAGQFIAGKATAVGRGDIFANDLVKFVRERSELVANRSISAEFELLKKSHNNLWMDINSKVGQAGMALFQAIDMTSIVIGWKAVYDRVYQETQNEVEAATAADKATIRGQPSGRVQDMAEMYRGSDVLRWLTMFTSALNALWNIALVDVPLAWKNKAKMHAAGDVTALVLSGIAIAIASGALAEDDPEERKKRLLAGAWSQFVDMIPYVGSDISAVIQGRPTGQGVKFFSSIQGLSLAVRAIREGELEAAARGLSEAVLFGAGMPVTGPKRLLKALESGEITDLMGWK